MSEQLNSNNIEIVPKKERHINSEREIARNFLNFFEREGFMSRERFKMTRTSKNLTVVNSTIAPYIPEIHPDNDPAYNDCLVQPCIRMQSLNNETNLLADEHYSTMFLMCGSVSTERSLPDTIDSLKRYLSDFIDTSRLYYSIPTSNPEMLEALKKLKIDSKRILQLTNNEETDGEIWVDWQFDDPGPTGQGITFLYDQDPNATMAPKDRLSDLSEFANVIAIDRYLEGGNFRQLRRPVIEAGFGIGRLMNLAYGLKPFDTTENQSIILRLTTESYVETVKEQDKQAWLRLLTIVDHIKSVKLLLQDNLRPGKRGAEYVLRRLIRNLLLQAYLLGCLDDRMKRFYTTEENIIITAELDKFRQRLARAHELILAQEPKPIDEHYLSFLKETYGIPREITAHILTTIKSGAKAAVPESNNLDEKWNS